MDRAESADASVTTLVKFIPDQPPLPGHRHPALQARGGTPLPEFPLSNLFYVADVPTRTVSVVARRRRAA